MTLSEKLDVDELLTGLDKRGRYQIFQFLIFLSTFILNGHLVLVTLFTGYQPDFQCDTSDINSLLPANDGYNFNDSYTVMYEKCKIHVFRNDTNKTFLTSTGCINGYRYSLQKDRSFLTEWDLVCENAGLAELSMTLFMLGKGMGSLVLPQITDKYGRLKILALSCFVAVILSVVIGLVKNIASFIALRFALGFVQQGKAIAGYILMLELFPSDDRMYVEILSMGMWTTSMIVLGLIAYLMRNLNWRYLQIAVPAASVHMCFLYWVFDESPRWLIANGKIKEAEKIIRKVARWNKASYSDAVERAHLKAIELENMSKAKDEGNKSDDGIKHYTLLTLLGNKRILMNSFIVWFAWVTVTMVYYALTMASSSSLSGDRFVNYTLLALMEYPVVVVEYFLFKRIGRKALSLFFYGLSAVSLIIATILSSLNEDGTYTTVAFAMSLIGKFGVSGAFSVIYLYTPELYPTNLRNIGMGTASMFGRIGAMIAPFAGILASKVSWGPGVIFSAMCLVATLLILLLPETRGKELPTTIKELKEWYKGKK